MAYLERWFPKETKEKQRSNERDRRVELFGEAYAEANNAPCTVM